MSSTTKRMWRMPGALAGAGRSSPSYEGERYLASSTLPLPSGVRSITISACTPSSPFMRSTEPPSTDASPSNSSPSAAKNAIAAARSSTTMPMCSRRWTVMNGLRPAPAACTRRAADTSASWSPGVVGRAARGPSPDSGAGQRFSTLNTHSTPRSSRRENPTRHCVRAGAIRAGTITWRPVSPARAAVSMTDGYTDTTVAESTDSETVARSPLQAAGAAFRTRDHNQRLTSRIVRQFCDAAVPWET